MTARTKDSAAYRYYAPLVGAWSGALAFEITQPSALSKLLIFARMSLRFMSWTGRSFGPLRMNTTLAHGARDDEFIHTTRVRMRGIPLFDTDELIRIDEDGVRLSMNGTQRSLPPLGPRVPYESRGEVAPSAKGATYLIPFFGLELTQRTELVGENALQVHQDTSATRGSVLLERVR